MTKAVVNIDALEMKASSEGTRFGSSAGRIGRAIGLRQLGAQYYVVPAGRSAVPYHSHRANEELYLVLEGTGTYRYGGETHEVRAGDLLAALAGGPETAHQLTNTGTGELRYVVVSTRNDPDICEYPDSGKFMVASGIPPHGGMMGAEFVLRGRDKPQLDYWDGEDIGEEE